MSKSTLYLLAIIVLFVLLAVVLAFHYMIVGPDCFWSTDLRSCLELDVLS